ncbi:hypothetical protein STEG23_037040, partial [Scotinomys teguina]
MNVHEVRHTVILLLGLEGRVCAHHKRASPSAIHGYGRTWWADGTATSFRLCLCEEYFVQQLVTCLVLLEAGFQQPTQVSNSQWTSSGIDASQVSTVPEHLVARKHLCSALWENKDAFHFKSVWSKYYKQNEPVGSILVVWKGMEPVVVMTMCGVFSNRLLTMYLRLPELSRFCVSVSMGAIFVQVMIRQPCCSVCVCNIIHCCFDHIRPSTIFCQYLCHIRVPSCSSIQSNSAWLLPKHLGRYCTSGHILPGHYSSLQNSQP